jgi:hypothetical protein
MDRPVNLFRQLIQLVAFGLGCLSKRDERREQSRVIQGARDSNLVPIGNLGLLVTEIGGRPLGSVKFIAAVRYRLI